ncbi:MAG: PAS domain-containing protein [Armatimonadetes bacterium]|nr:PAS domain-containing protein [Armatimonadota bacterium]
MPKNVLGKIYETLAENINDALISINKEGKIILFNQKAGNLFNLDPQKIVQKKIWDILVTSEFTRSLVSIVKNAEGAYREQIILFPNERLFLMQIFPVKNPEGKNIAALAILKDLTELRKIEKTMHQLIIDVSHELKTPITSIKGFIETLLEGSYQDHKVCYHFLQIINEETNRLIRLIINLLDLSIGGQKIQDMTFKPIDPAKLINTLYNMFKPLAEAKNLILEIESSLLPIIKGNEDALMQVLTNLMDNAVKFTGILNKGKIKISAQILEGEGKVKIDITDTGIGIDKKNLNKIFEQYYRIKDGPASKLGGIGLGLSISKQIIEAHKGEIKVKSIHGKGSTFSIILPV